ncbi:MAG TPA: formylglycine-generating enzyme family protein [Vicinamibacterales bacterium]|nr:formylglycine-generating enzyme family protein [Vicinamibacterales bacterium]
MPTDLIPELVLIAGGEFVMGSDEADPDERPAHRVHVDDFFIGVQPVTNREYARFVRETGRRAPELSDLPLVARTGGSEREQQFRTLAQAYAWKQGEPPADRAEHPVTLVRYDDAAAYCAWLAGVTGRPFRLPTEAEWEKGARGGIDGRRYPWGDRLEPAAANYLDDPAVKPTRGTTPCRTFPPNDYGLYDVVGNVWEWVQDWYGAAYYDVAPSRNPQGPAKGSLRIVRGGSWLVADVRMLTCSHRHKVPVDTYSYGIGLRVACARE